MAEENKTQFKSVEVDFDPTTGESTVKPVEQPKKEEEESQEEETQEEESTEEEQTQEEESTEESEEDTQEEEVEETEDVEDSEEEIEESTEDEEEESQEEIEDEEVVDFEELPESVQKFLDFHNDTGGSLEDFVNINQDLSKLPQDEVISRFLKTKYPSLDNEDIQYEIESRFGEEEDDTEADIRRKKVEKKKFYADALKTLERNAEKYKTELGSSKGLPAEAVEAIEFKKNFESQQQQQSKQMSAVRSSFVKQTNKLLGKNFKGFEVKVGEETHLYKPENVSKVKEQNLDVNNFLGRFLDKDGSVKDVEGYHKSLAIASDPEGYAQHFYELGKAAMLEEESKDSKNVQTKPRGNQPKPKSKQPKFKFLDGDSSTRSGKIKLKNY